MSATLSPPAPRTAASVVSDGASTKSTRMIYIRNEHGQFVCPTCGVVKKNQSTMHYHMKTHEETMEFKCKTCSKEFIHAQALKTHMEARHAKEKKAKGIRCPMRGCEIESASKGNCRTHFLRIHCAKETAELLDRDMKTGDIHCTGCGSEFGSLSAFYYHAVLCIDLPAADARAAMLDSIL